MNFKNFTRIFITYDVPASIYSITDISEAIYIMGGHGGTMQIEKDDISMKTKPNLT